MPGTIMASVWRQCGIKNIKRKEGVPLECDAGLVKYFEKYTKHFNPISENDKLESWIRGKN